jgi:hypothetical protein
MPPCSRDSHAEVKADPIRFRDLAYLGVVRMDGDGPDIELRNCPHCASTLAMEVSDAA